MRIVWQKAGRIYVPSGEGFFKTHATRPIPYAIDSTTLRLYFSSRDDEDMPYPTYIDVDMSCPSNVIDINSTPLMRLGRAGTFDDSGITPTCILRHGGIVRMYYVGWKRRRFKVTIEASIGIADLSNNGNTLTRVFEGPIIGQDKYHPFMAAAPFVLFDGTVFKMWYCSGTEWKISADATPEPIYTVFYAESVDGIIWQPYRKPVIDYQFDGEIISAPWVIKIGDHYHMWYSTRGYVDKQAKKFSIGYAESPDGIHWTRLDNEAGISTSDSGWDSEMICYPSFFPYQDVMYMFYSGNGVGKGGLGYAVSKNFLW